MRNNNGAYFLIGLIGVLAFIVWLSTNNTTEPIDFQKALNDTLKTYRSKDSLHNAEISVIEADRKELLKVINGKDEEICDLLRNPKVKEVIKIKVITKWDSILVADSVGADCSASWEFDNGFISADIRVHRDTLEFKHLTVRNDLQITHEEQKETTIIHIKQLNPYSSTTYIKNYVVQRPVKKNKWLKNLLIGIGVGVTVGALVR